MIKFNANNKIDKINFESKLKEEKMVKPVKDFLSELVQRAEFEVHDTGTFREIELLTDNPNQYQEVAKYGFRIRPDGSSNNSKERILEFAATKKSEHEKTTAYELCARGTREEILAKLKDPKILDDLQTYVKKASKDFFIED